MKVGINLLVVGGYISGEHAVLLERLKVLGYDGVEVPVFEGDVGHYRALGSLLADLGLAATICAIVTEDENPISRDVAVRNRARDRLHWSVDCAEALGAEVMMGPFHSPLGVFTGDGPNIDEIERLADAMHDVAGYAGDAGVRISLEPLNRFECYALNTLAQASDLHHRVGHANFGYTYDTFHANIEERDPVAAYRRCAGEVNHIHISENDRGIPGRGHGPIAASIRAARAAGYDDWLTVEAFGRSVPALAAATRVWRDLFPDSDTLFSESIAVIHRLWAEASIPEHQA